MDQVKEKTAHADLGEITRQARLYIPLEVIRYMALTQRTLDEVHSRSLHCDVPPLMLQIPFDVFTEDWDDAGSFVGTPEKVVLNIILRPRTLPDVSGLEQHFRSALRGLLDLLDPGDPVGVTERLQHYASRVPGDGQL